MKKTLAILFLLTVLFSGMSITYSAHYCQGKFFASRLSLTGMNTTCGMDQGRSENKATQFSNLMCENKISKYLIFGDYIYIIHQGTINRFYHIELPSLLTLEKQAPSTSKETNQLPPGFPDSSKIGIEYLCVFRI